MLGTDLSQLGTDLSRVNTCSLVTCELDILEMAASVCVTECETGVGSVTDLQSLLERIASLESSVATLKEENLFLKSKLQQAPDSRERGLEGVRPRGGEGVRPRGEESERRQCGEGERRQCGESVRRQCGKSDGWQVVGSKGSTIRLKKAPTVSSSPVLECRNSFSALAEGTEEGPRTVEERTTEEERTDEPSLSNSKILVVGDSQVKYLDRTFCARDRKRRTRVCFPGAGVEDVSDRLDRCMAGEGERPIVCLSVGTNDVGRVRSEELFRRFREALGKIRDRGAVPVVCGIIPRRDAGAEWLSRAIAMNCRIANHCGSNGWAFLDTWDLFYGENSLYARDGVHLSRRGVGVLSDALERRLGEVKGFFR